MVYYDTCVCKIFVRENNKWIVEHKTNEKTQKSILFTRLITFKLKKTAITSKVFREVFKREL
jgi:hypothetical protein